LWVHIYLHKPKDFDIVPKLIGSRGCNMIEIMEATSAKLRIRGKGSGHYEVDGVREAPVPLMLAITANKDEPDLFILAVKMAIMKLEDLYVEFRRYCQPKPADIGRLFSFGELSEIGRARLEPLILRYAAAEPNVRKTPTPAGHRAGKRTQRGQRLRWEEHPAALDCNFGWIPYGESDWAGCQDHSGWAVGHEDSVPAPGVVGMALNCHLSRVQREPWEEHPAALDCNFGWMPHGEIDWAGCQDHSGWAVGNEDTETALGVVALLRDTFPCSPDDDSLLSSEISDAVAKFLLGDDDGVASCIAESNFVQQAGESSLYRI
jgi:hypothetical protein